MALEDITAELEKLAKENPKLDPKFITDRISQENQTFLTKKRELDTENKNLRAFKKAVQEDLGFDPEGDVPLTEFVKGVKEKIGESETLKDKGTKSNAEVLKLQKDLAKLTGDLEKERVEKGKAEKRARDQTIKTRLLKDLTTGAQRMAGAEAHAKTLIFENQVGLDDNGEVVFLEGENQVSYEDGLKKFFERNKSDILNAQEGGSGAAGPGAPASGGITKEDEDFVNQVIKDRR